MPKFLFNEVLLLVPYVVGYTFRHLFVCLMTAG